MYPSILCGIIHYKWARMIPLWVASSNQDRLRPIYRTLQATNYSKQAKSSLLLGHAAFTGSVFDFKLESAKIVSQVSKCSWIFFFSRSFCGISPTVFWGFFCFFRYCLVPYGIEWVFTVSQFASGVICLTLGFIQAALNLSTSSP